jgi:hypothetical protein
MRRMPSERVGIQVEPACRVPGAMSRSDADKCAIDIQRQSERTAMSYGESLPVLSPMYPYRLGADVQLGSGRSCGKSVRRPS